MTRHVHRFRQSWINTYLKCPEQARRLLAGEVEPTGHTDSTALGTAVHAGIEHALVHGDGGPDAIEYTLDSLEWRYTKYSRDKVYELAHQAYETWVRDISHLCRPKATEESFSELLYEDRWREIHLTGTADCIDYGGFVWDWKTASRPYDAWEYQRYAVQPTVYCTAFNIKRFRYGIMVLDGSAQIIDVERDDSHTAFLIELLLGASRLIEKGIKPWPLNPSGWWCAKRWCPAYATCRGAHIDDGASR